MSSKKVEDQKYIETPRSRVPVPLFVMAAALATLVFGWIVFLFAMLPGLSCSGHAWTLAVVAVLLVIPLGLGLLRTRTSVALVATSKACSVIAALLACELIFTLIGVIRLVITIASKGNLACGG